jgi:hypothetical protein
MAESITNKAHEHRLHRGRLPVLARSKLPPPHSTATKLRASPLQLLPGAVCGLTFTRALLAGNPALPGSSGTACEATDQRGIARPLGVRCDIGAVEQGVDPPTWEQLRPA